MNAVKAVIAAALAALAAYFEILLVPVLVLIACMAADYATGIAAAYISNKLCSKIGIIGILKKVGYLAIVAVGMGIDYVISLAGEQLGAEVNTGFLCGLLVCVWLIVNELISILENADRMGLPVPSFLGKLLARLKTRSEGTESE